MPATFGVRFHSPPHSTSHGDAWRCPAGLHVTTDRARFLAGDLRPRPPDPPADPSRPSYQPGRPPHAWGGRTRVRRCSHAAVCLRAQAMTDSASAGRYDSVATSKRAAFCLRRATLCCCKLPCCVGPLVRTLLAWYGRVFLKGQSRGSHGAVPCSNPLVPKAKRGQARSSSRKPKRAAVRGEE